MEKQRSMVLEKVKVSSSELEDEEEEEGSEEVLDEESKGKS